LFIGNSDRKEEITAVNTCSLPWQLVISLCQTVNILWIQA